MSFSWSPFGWLNLGIDLAAAAAGLGLAVLIGRRLGEHSAKNLVRGLFAAGVLWMPLAWWIGGIVGFALLARVGWTTVTVALPLGLAWLFARSRHPWAAAAALSLVAAKYYGEVWEPANLKIERLQVRLPGLARPVKVAHLSDVQTDSFWSLHDRVREAANAFDPDLVVFTGDLINHPSLAPQAARFLQGFRHRHGKFFVTGDVDRGYDLPFLLREGGFELLDGQARALDLGGARLGLIGLGLWDAFEPGLAAGLGARLRGLPRVLLSHRPDAIFAAKGAAELVLAGHTHGGQVCLPWFGPLVTLTQAPRKIAAGGLHRFGDLAVIVSRGLGWEGHVAPRVRAFCPPHLVLIELLPP